VTLTVFGGIFQPLVRFRCHRPGYNHHADDLLAKHSTDRKQVTDHGPVVPMVLGNEGVSLVKPDADMVQLVGHARCSVTNGGQRA
jgi:hypothetical protein